ncbi:MAG: nuclear transport factor 2 family protein [Flavobacteriales bacterium]
MHHFQIALIPIVLLLGNALNAQTDTTQSDMAQIEETLMNYINGTANGDVEMVKKAFHPEFNLYMVSETDSLRIRNGAEYIAKIKAGEKNTRQGRVVSIDFENNAAMAKAVIDIPGWRIFTDYFLLMKYEGEWRIVQKSYTWTPYPKAEEKE